MKKQCLNCRYWGYNDEGPNGHYDPNDYGHHFDGYYNRGRQFCNKIDPWGEWNEAIDGPIPDGACIVTDQYGCFLSTDAEFSCSLWEPQRPEEERERFKPELATKDERELDAAKRIAEFQEKMRQDLPRTFGGRHRRFPVRMPVSLQASIGAAAEAILLLDKPEINVNYVHYGAEEMSDGSLSLTITIDRHIICRYYSEPSREWLKRNGLAGGLSARSLGPKVQESRGAKVKKRGAKRGGNHR